MDTIKHPSPNFNVRQKGTPIDMLVLHYTGMPSAQAALERLCDPRSAVSAHYLIDEDGTLYELVPEKMRAWHAGVSAWRGNTNINDRSIGIEIVNPGHEFGYRAFTDKQMFKLLSLCTKIIERHPIPQRNVVGHSDVAPTRKMDPGELFDWQLLADKGIGLMPDSKLESLSSSINISTFSSAINTYGYDTSDLKSATRAFQRHFLPNSITGAANTETVKSLETLMAQFQ